ncbi:Protein of unknown function [Propionibacterium freudenreichii]|nr:Protein of unknown function [Propionibacterium freudenreichii]
MTLRHYPT